MTRHLFSTILLCGLLWPCSATALDMKLGATNTFNLRILDRYGVGLTNRSFSNIDVAFKCLSAASPTLINEAGADVLAEDSASQAPGSYKVTFDDTITCANEQTLEVWAIGADVAVNPTRVKVVGATIDNVTVGATACLKFNGCWGTVTVAGSPAATTTSFASTSFNATTTNAYDGLEVECPGGGRWAKIQRLDPATDEVFIPLGEACASAFSGTVNVGIATP